MSFKHINLIINENDIRSTISNCLGKIFKRQSDELQNIIEKLNTNRDEQTTAEILELTRKILKNNRRASEEIENLSPLILSLDLNPEDLELSLDTEVVEDLPDLQENSLGVDGGSE